MPHIHPSIQMKVVHSVHWDCLIEIVSENDNNNNNNQKKKGKNKCEIISNGKSTAADLYENESKN